MPTRPVLPEDRSSGPPDAPGCAKLLPDTVPILSASAKTRGVYYATGHGHLGLTYAATTARLMGELVTGAKPSVDLHPYRVNRF